MKQHFEEAVHTIEIFCPFHVTVIKRVVNKHLSPSIIQTRTQSPVGLRE